MKWIQEQLLPWSWMQPATDRKAPKTVSGKIEDLHRGEGSGDGGGTCSGKLYGNQMGTYIMCILKGMGVSLLGRNWLRHIRLARKSIVQIVNRVSECYQPLLDG